MLTSPSAKRILTGAGALPELAELPIVGFGGECCEKEIASLSAAIAVHHADVLVGMGGGKAIDTAKIAADRAGIRAADASGSERLVASTVALPYGDEFAWVSMVLVLPEFRGRGYASLLLRHALGELAWRGIAAILDATPAGRLSPPRDRSRRCGACGRRSRWP